MMLTWLDGSTSDTMFVNDADIRLDGSTSGTMFVNDADMARWFYF